MSIRMEKYLSTATPLGAVLLSDAAVMHVVFFTHGEMRILRGDFFALRPQDAISLKCITRDAHPILSARNAQRFNKTLPRKCADEKMRPFSGRMPARNG